MAITERLMGAGSFSLQFIQDSTPTQVVDAIKEWGHIVVTPQEMDPKLYDDAEILASARYTGIVLNKTLEEGVVSIQGQGLELYLGDGQGKGMVIAESKNVGKIRSYSNASLSDVIDKATQPYGILRNESGNTQAIVAGQINTDSIAYSYSGSHFVETTLSALKHICETLNVEYRVNPDATLDVDNPAFLWNGAADEPSTVVVKTGYGDDPTYTGISPVGSRTEFNARDYVTGVDFIAEIGVYNDATDVEGEARLNTGEIPYYDIHGNKLQRTGLVTTPDIDGDKLDDQAQLMLNELSRIKKVLNLDLEQYEVTGDLKAGDYIYAFDPSIGFNDTEEDATAESRPLYQIAFRGQNIAPVKIRVLGLTYPITEGMGVYFRSFDGSNVTYTDLTEYVSYESGDTQVELGDLLRDVSDDLRFNEISIAARTASAKSIPDLPNTPALQSGTYQDSTGESKGFVRIVLDKPSNVDGSQITDGSHYRVRYRVSDGLSTSGGASANEYTYKDFPFTGASTEQLMITDLTVGKAYRVGVSTVDTSGFKKKSAYDGTGEDLYTDTPSVNANWATNAVIEIDRDGQAPSKPKQAQAISSSPLRVQITHYLGKEGTDGQGNPFGDYTLEGDVDHLDVHAVTQNGNQIDFTVNESNKRGELRVTSGNILQQIPLVGYVELEDSQSYYFRFVAVDKSGNASDPSDGQTAVANLIEEANIADATITEAKIGTAQITTAKIADATITDAKIQSLTADKITAGTIDASVITVTNLDASNITAGTLDANTVTISNLTVDVGDINNLNFSSLGATSQDIINTIATDAILSTISNGAISEVKLGNISAGKITTGTLDASVVNIANLTVDVADINNLSFSSLNATSTDIINTIASNAIQDAKIASGLNPSKVSGFGAISGNQVVINASSGLAILYGELTMNNRGISNANDLELNNGSSFSSSGNLYATGTVRSASYHSATRYYDINSSSNMDLASSFVYLKPGDNFGLNVSTSTSTIYSTFQPSADNSKNLGSSTRRWSTVYRVAESSTSDERLKENIIDIDYGLDFINNLRPREFTWKSWSNGFSCSTCGQIYESVQDCTSQIKSVDENDEEILIDCTGNVTEQFTEADDKYTFGFIAQEMLPNLGTEKEYNLLNHNTESDEYNYSQENLIAPLVKAVQELSAKVDDLTARIEVLEAN